MTQLNNTRLSHADLQAPRIRKDFADVQSIIGMLESDWINPIGTEETELVSLSTGQIACEDITRDLLGAHRIGEQAYKEFKEQRLESNPPALKFHDKMTKQKLKTFSDMKKKKGITKASGKEVVLKADRNLFGQMILVAQSRNIDLKEVLAHPLGPIPWSLATPEGSLRKTNKAALAKALIQNIKAAESIPSPSACVIDGMSIVQKLKGDNRTFAQIARRKR